MRTLIARSCIGQPGFYHISTLCHCFDAECLGGGETPPPYLPYRSVLLLSSVSMYQSSFSWCFKLSLSPIFPHAVSLGDGELVPERNLPFCSSHPHRQHYLQANRLGIQQLSFQFFVQIVLRATSTLPDGYHCNCWNIMKSSFCSIGISGNHRTSKYCCHQQSRNDICCPKVVGAQTVTTSDLSLLHRNLSSFRVLTARS